jgi:hypothetical protein
MPDAIAFWSKDDKVNLSVGVLEAWDQKPETILVPGADDESLLFAADEEADDEPDDGQDHPGVFVGVEDIKRMLDDKADWRLAVGNGDKTEVLSRRRLDEAWNSGTAGTLELPLEYPTNQDRRILEDANEYFGPHASIKRLEDSINVPIASIGAVATVGGLFGFLAIDEKIQHPGALLITTGAAVVALVLALFGRHGLRRKTVQLNRIDQIEARFGSILNSGWLRRSRIALGLLAVAFIFAALAVFPGAADTTSVKISAPRTGGDGGIVKPHVKVSWSDLGEAVVAVRAIVMQGERRLTYREDKSAADMTQEFDPELSASGGSYIVTAEMLGKGDKPIGAGFARSFEIF